MGTLRPAANWVSLADLTAFGVVLGVIFHLLARRTLGGLEN